MYRIQIDEVQPIVYRAGGKKGEMMDTNAATTRSPLRRFLSAFRFFPTPHDFYGFFQQAGENIVAGADVLRRMFAEVPGRENLRKSLEEHEHIGDRITKEVIELLHKTFLTPIDREDIHTLVTKLDDVMDHMYSVGSRLTLYEVQSAPVELTQMAGIIHRSAQEILKALTHLHGLKKPQAVIASCLEVGRLENEADEAMNHVLVDLFRNERSPQHLIQLKELVEGLERTTDRCKDVTEVLQGIVLKHA